jgi:hypothetical protein
LEDESEVEFPKAPCEDGGVSSLDLVAPAFIEMVHPIIYATLTTVDRLGRPRGRIVHPYWTWDGSSIIGWVATSPTPVKRDNMKHNLYVSVTYWSPRHDTCTAECRCTWVSDNRTRVDVWNLLKNAPPPVGYDPAIVPMWSGGPTAESFAALRLTPWRLRVFPGTVLLGQGGEVLNWRAPGEDSYNPSEHLVQEAEPER